VSAYPILLDGARITALVVGGGQVATRKVRALLDAGARVHVVAPEVSAEIEAWCAADGEAVRVTRGSYAPEHVAPATLVIAATDNAALNAAVAEDARAAGTLVNVSDAPELGDFVTPAVHRSGDVVIAVGAGGVPKAAARIRDAIAVSIGDRYGIAIDSLSRLRRELLDRGERDAWHAASAELISASFCADVEADVLRARIDAWR
jgi:precorrin-2 dehydrogenase/sirohydrochlorin ferrochelatase